MSIGECGDLGEMGDDHDLGMGGQLGKASADVQPGLAADPGVDLVEDERGDGCPGRRRRSPG